MPLDFLISKICTRKEGIVLFSLFIRIRNKLKISQHISIFVTISKKKEMKTHKASLNQTDLNVIF